MCLRQAGEPLGAPGTVQQGGRQGRWTLGGTASGESGILGSSGASPSGTDTCRGDSTFLGALGQRHRENPNLEQVGVTHMEFPGREAARARQSWSNLA